jgi:hypothetical protein
MRASEYKAAPYCKASFDTLGGTFRGIEGMIMARNCVMSPLKYVRLAEDTSFAPVPLLTK